MTTDATRRYVSLVLIALVMLSCTLVMVAMFGLMVEP